MTWLLTGRSSAPGWVFEELGVGGGGKCVLEKTGFTFFEIFAFFWDSLLRDEAKKWYGCDRTK